MFGDVYAGRRVFVTGHTGFKGSWLTLWLLDLGADVSGFALEPPTEPSLFEVLGFGSQAGGADAKDPHPVRGGRLTDLRGDVRDREALAAALRNAAPEIVFHLAAQPMVRRSYAEPHLTYETNVMGTVNLLEGVRELADGGRSPRVVVNVTSDKCYENMETRRAYVEGDPLGGFDPYSSSKGCAELVTAAYRRSFFASPGTPAVVSARAGNVIGGGDWGEDRILPDCVKALRAGVPVEVRNPGAVRPWQHVLESLSGYLCLAAALWRGDVARDAETAPAAGAWNFGPSDDALVPVLEIVEGVVRAWGAGEWRSAPAAVRQPHEAGLLVLDAGKAGRELGWRPAWGVDEAVTVAVRWYKEFEAGAGAERLAELCRDDIARYGDMAGRAGASWADDETLR